MPKNIVVMSDGTGQDGGTGFNTNIYKLFNILENRTKEQIVFYDPGLGSRWYRPIGKVFGYGISKNIIQCYKFIFENYESGDNIYLFGFSRGAATVRSLSALIHLFGILPKSRPELIKKAYKIYKKKDHERLAKEFIEKHHTMWTKINFLGVYDTVAALRFSSSFHNFKLSPSVISARHAIAIDEKRVPFMPLIWDKNIKDHQDMKQVHFLGVHTDVGGGYAETGLSDISFNWMLQEAVEKGLKIYPKAKNERSPNPNEKMNREKWMIKPILPYCNQERSWNESKHGPLFIHPTVLERTKDQYNDGSEYQSWVLRRNYVLEGE